METNIKKYKIVFKDLMRLLNVSQLASSKNVKVRGRRSNTSSTTYYNTNNMISILDNITIYDFNSTIIGFQIIYNDGSIEVIEDHTDIMIEKIKIMNKYLINNIAGVNTHFKYFKEFIKTDNSFINELELEFEEDIKDFQTTRMNRNFRNSINKEYSVIVYDEIKWKYDEAMEIKEKIEKIRLECNKLEDEYTKIGEEYHKLYDEKMNEYSHDNIVELDKDDKKLEKIVMDNYNKIEKYKFILDKEKVKEIKFRML